MHIMDVRRTSLLPPFQVRTISLSNCSIHWARSSYTDDGISVGSYRPQFERSQTANMLRTKPRCATTAFPESRNTNPSTSTKTLRRPNAQAAPPVPQRSSFPQSPQVRQRRNLLMHQRTFDSNYHGCSRQYSHDPSAAARLSSAPLASHCTSPQSRKAKTPTPPPPAREHGANPSLPYKNPAGLALNPSCSGEKREGLILHGRIFCGRR
ncbi:hypothetical protein Mapa_013584 [Marchantia paleacea]|nr:hypothetical protein Mapa_013584 [Marchantia paleacea]